MKQLPKDSINSNYQPISLSSIPCKIIEGFIRDHIMKCLNDNNNQYGFLKGRSTMLQLLRTMDEWTECLESGGQINVIYADFEKAFDKVSHKLLIRKLRYYKVNESVILRIELFLFNRKQRVKINGFYSDRADVLSGIPQGIILGFILFIIYINDLPDVCKQFINIYLLADAAKLYKRVITDNDSQVLQKGLNTVQE